MSTLRKSLKKRVLDYFKEDFWADTAAFRAEPATKAGLEFTRAIRSCSPPIARSIRREGPCFRARRCGFSRSKI